MNSKQYQKFDDAMTVILRANPKAVKEAMEREKQANAKKRKAKPSALGRAPSGKD